MNTDPRVESWLIALLDGVQNSNSHAEVIAQAAYNFAHPGAKIEAEFRQCLCDISFTHAGYDVREMPPAQKASEAATSSIAMSLARAIWVANPDMHDELRAVFQELQPLVEMREIEDTP